MKNEKLDLLVNKCAKVAAKGSDIKSYMIIYITKDEQIHYDKDGDDTAILGMMEIAKRGIINSYN